jgi:hypothetical protein
MTMSTILPLLLALYVVGLWVIVQIKARRRHRKLTILRAEANDTTTLIRIPISVKVRYPRGWWGLRTMSPMELTAGSRTLAVTTKPKGIGARLGNEWFFDAKLTNIRHASHLPLDFLHREWLVIQGVSANRPAEIAIRPVGAFDEAWAALLHAGCQSIDHPLDGIDPAP